MYVHFISYAAAPWGVAHTITPSSIRIWFDNIERILMLKIYPEKFNVVRCLYFAIWFSSSLIFKLYLDQNSPCILHEQKSQTFRFIFHIQSNKQPSCVPGNVLQNGL